MNLLPLCLAANAADEAFEAALREDGFASREDADESQMSEVTRAALASKKAAYRALLLAFERERDESRPLPAAARPHPAAREA